MKILLGTVSNLNLNDFHQTKVTIRLDASEGEIEIPWDFLASRDPSTPIPDPSTPIPEYKSRVRIIIEPVDS